MTYKDPEKKRENLRAYVAKLRSDPAYLAREREQQREYRSRPDVREDRNAKRRERRATNPETQRKERERERQRNARPEVKRRKTANAASWRAANPEAAKAIYHRRRARKLGAEGDHTAEDLAHIMRAQAHRCPCGADFHTEKPTLDHIIPLSRGGTNSPDNLQFMCAGCNSSKWNMTMDEWVDAGWLEHRRRLREL